MAQRGVRCRHPFRPDGLDDLSYAADAYEMFGVRIWSLRDREELDDELWDAMKAGIEAERRRVNRA